MSRAAFIMDKVMGKAGLHGKAFIPLLRLVRLRDSRHHGHPHPRIAKGPAHHDDDRPRWLQRPSSGLHAADCGVHSGALPRASSPPGLTMTAMYLLGIVLALLIALLLKKTVLRGEKPGFVMELPLPYAVAQDHRAHPLRPRKVFLQNAGRSSSGYRLCSGSASYPKIEGATAPERSNRVTPGGWER